MSVLYTRENTGQQGKETGSGPRLIMRILETNNFTSLGLVYSFIKWKLSPLSLFFRHTVQWHTSGLLQLLQSQPLFSRVVPDLPLACSHTHARGGIFHFLSPVVLWISKVARVGGGLAVSSVPLTREGPWAQDSVQRKWLRHCGKTCSIVSSCPLTLVRQALSKIQGSRI